MPKRFSQFDFVKKATSIHQNDYDYSQSEFVTMKVPVEVICNKCEQPFSITPNNHIYHAQGCPICEVQVQSDEQVDEQLTADFPQEQQESIQTSKCITIKCLLIQLGLIAITGTALAYAGFRPQFTFMSVPNAQCIPLDPAFLIQHGNPLF